MPRMAYHLVGKPINSFADCDEDLKEHFRCYFTHWANNHMADAKKLTDEELEDAVDENAFEFWNSSDPLQAPRFVKPKMTEMMVQIGVFKKVEYAVICPGDVLADQDRTYPTLGGILISMIIPVPAPMLGLMLHPRFRADPRGTRHRRNGKLINLPS
jgi:hypothetical protein